MLSKDVAIINGMVRTKDSNSTGTKAEQEQLRSLQRQLATSKRTGGDREYEKELEADIEELIAKINRETER
jgi:hypothetical protein